MFFQYKSWAQGDGLSHAHMLFIWNLLAKQSQILANLSDEADKVS